MRIEAGVATDIGRVRERNDDSFLVEPPLYAVADGMGGHRGGDVASQLALTTIEELFRSGRGSLAQQAKEANAAVFERSAADKTVAGMGTTLTAALIEGEKAHLVHVGDSRAYLLRAGAFRQLTEDHTLVNRMIRAGEITRQEADVHPHRNVLTRALGTEPDVDVDESDLGLLEGDRLLLCSDGLTAMVAEEQIQAILESTRSPQEAAERLVRAANNAGGLDNITVVVLDVREGESGGEGEMGRPAGTGSPGHAPPSPESPGTGGPTALDRSGSAGSARSAAGRRRLWRWGAVAALVVVVLAAAYTGLRVFVDRQWYVGVANGHVAIYQGIPAKILGFSLSSVEEETTISAENALATHKHDGLTEGVSVDSIDEARDVVAAIEKDVLIYQRQQRRGSP
jgi:serine/threonine protein phosphatase PrpC